MSHINSCIVDSTDTRMIDLIEAGHSSNKLSKDPQTLACIPSVRHFGNGSAVSHELNPSGNCTAFRDNNVLDESLVEKQLYDRSSAFLKCDSVAWEDFADVQGANESLPGTSLSLPSPAGACTFIKDEKEPSVIMETVCTNFDSAPDLPALDAVCDTNGKPHLGFTGHESASCPPAATGPQLEGPPNFLIDPNQPEHPLKPDSKCVFSGKPALNFDARHPIQQLQVYKNEVPRWQTQATPAEPQYWCQPAGLTEDPFMHNAYDGMQNQTAAQRGSTSFSAFPGVLPQRQCVICSDEASGCHYGVLTCGSCKVFFKRAVEGHHSYLCAGRNDCIVDKIRRKNCPACRLRKCYQAGMMLGGRKLKRFGALKALDLASSLMFQSHISVSNDNQALSTMSCIPGIREVQLSQQIISILENIEPDTVYADHDNSKPDVPHLLNSLNRLCEKQLLWIVRWSKNLPGFRNLHISDQMTLIQYSWMNLMVFSLGWRSFQNVTTDYLYFAPDLVLSQEQMRRSPIYDLCQSIQFIPQEFANLHVTREEFLCMKAIILLNTVPLEGLKSQGVFEEMRQNYIRELTKAIHMKEKGLVASSQRFYHLTKLMDAMHNIVKNINLYCLSTFIQADAMHVEFPEMMTEVIASQLPKVLAGMVRPLLFHTK